MRPSARFLVFLALFFLSGAAALVYEVLWLRRLGILFGSTAYATTATLGSFMAGLGIGGYLGGRWASRTGNPLRAYSLVEIGIAAGALLVDPLLGASAPLLGGLYGAGSGKLLLDAARLVLSFLVLLAPTALMGATLPLLAQSAVRSTRSVAAPLGLLYGANTLGAALGSFAAAFFLLEHFGARGSFQAALLLNGLIAAAALVFSRSGGAGEAPGKPEAETRTRAASRARLPLFAFGLSGFAALVSEVVWTRRLVFFIGSTSYAFALMLSLFLLSTALGSFLAGRLGDRIESANRALAFAFAFAAAGLAAGTLLLPALASTLEPWMMSDPAWPRRLAYMVVLAGAVVLAPAMAFGAVFPLVARAEVASGSRAGPAVGAAYAANVLGAVAGAYAGGFALIPFLGLAGTLRLEVAALLLFAALLSWRARTRLVAAGLLLAAPAALLLPAERLHRLGPGESLVHYEEGATATVSVVRDPLGSKSLYVDGVPVAGTDPVMMTDQKSLAHLPLLLHPDARKVLTVGFGSGGASWSYTRYPSLERIDCVEIASEVVRAAPHLREANRDLFSDPRYRVVIDDARSHLQHASESYDVIATDCTDLQYRGNASLYTADYFDLCRRRLNPRGLVVVWMPLGGMSDSVFRMAVSTFASAFPEVSVWYMNNYPTHYLLLVGSEDDRAVSWEDLLSQLSVAEVREDLESIGLADPFRILATFLLDDAAVRKLVLGAEIHRDDHPLLELRAPRSTDRFAGARNLEALLDLAALENSQPRFATRYGDRQRRTIEAKLEPYLDASRHLNRGHVHYQNGLQDFESAIARYREAAEANPVQEREVEALVRATARTRDELLRAYETAASEPHRSPGVLLNYGLTLLAAGEPGRAMKAFEELAAERPELADAHLNLSRAALAAGDAGTALAAADDAVSAAPLRADAHFQRALALERSGRPEEAIEAYGNALRLRTQMVEARFNRGTILAGLGRLREAREEYELGLALRPGDARARMNFAGVLLLQGDESSAARELLRVVEAGGAEAPRAAEMLEGIARETR